MSVDVVARLLDQLRLRGLSVGPGDRPGELKLHGPREAATPEVMAALKEFKPLLLARLGRREQRAAEPAAEPAPEPEPEPEPERCRVCSRDVSDDEDRARLADPLFCDRGGAKAVVDGMGFTHEASERCPYKP